MSTTPKNTVVLKFGGSSVADADKIRSIATRVAERYKAGEHLVVVVSAMGKTTDGLIKLAGTVSEKSSTYKREMDMLLATGEQTSAALLAMALNDLGVNAISMNAFQFGMRTTDAHSNARIRDIDTERLCKELTERGVVVATGFQGVTDEGDLTTLGRGGSDTSAIAIAAALGCPCERYSDVVGVYTCDPKLVPAAKKLDYITYEEMLELAAAGAKVLHSRGVEIANKLEVKLYCGSSFCDKNGTWIVKELPEGLETPIVVGVAVKDETKVSVRGLSEDVGLYTRICNELAARRINLNMISLVVNAGKVSITFSVAAGDVAEVGPALNAALGGLEGWKMEMDDQVTEVSAVGAGMQSSSGVAGRFFGALQRRGIKVLASSTSEIKISVLVPRSQRQEAADALMGEFGLKN